MRIRAAKNAVMTYGMYDCTPSAGISPEMMHSVYLSVNTTYRCAPGVPARQAQDMAHVNVSSPPRRGGWPTHSCCETQS